MKILRIVVITALLVNLFATLSFAAPTDSKPETGVKTEQRKDDKNTDEHIHKGKCKKGKCNEDFKDPISFLKEKKEDIQKLEKEGKISKEEAERKIKKIDSKIKEIEEFNKLPLEQKREKLIEKFKKVMAEKVKEGKISQEKADELIKEYTKKIQEWDGKGMPKFYHKGHDKKGR